MINSNIVSINDTLKKQNNFPAIWENNKINILEHEPNDAGIAEFFRTIYSDKLRYNFSDGQWYVFKSPVWVRDETEQIRAFAIEAARRWVGLSNEISDKDKREKFIQWGMTLQKYSRWHFITDNARSLPPLACTAVDFDKNPDFLAVQNGVINLKNGKKLTGTPEMMLLKQCPVEYDENAKCEKWDQFLLDVFQENTAKIDFVFRALGYSLTGDTREQCFFILLGSGANGKSVFLQVISSILGPFSANTPSSSFITNRFNTENIPNDIAALKGKRFVTASEFDENSQFKINRIKALTGNDVITARFMRQEFFEFNPEFKIWLSTNHKPAAYDSSHAFWRRVRLIKFNRQFSGKDRDPEKLKELLKEKPGILNWLIGGCLAWRKTGLITPAEIEHETGEYKSENDIIGNFLKDCSIPKKGGFVEADLLLEKYNQWAAENSEAELKQMIFGKKMTEKGIEKTRKIINDKYKTVYVNIELNTP